MRRGRCGRLLQSSTTLSSMISPVLNTGDYCLKERVYFPEALNHLRSIQARDCAHLNNAFVGNYNQHYIQCTGNLTAPTSLPSWIAATSGLVQNTGSNKKASQGGGSGSGGGGGTGSSPSKKKRPNEDGNPEEPAKKSKTGGISPTNKSNGSISTESTISSLTASPQFTVKVKSKIDSSSSSSSGIEDASEELESTESPHSHPQKKSANAARFTPTGLQKESRLD